MNLEKKIMIPNSEISEIGNIFADEKILKEFL